MSEINHHLGQLGKRGRDKVTGFSGVITSIGFDLYGCVQAVINGGLKTDGSFSDQIWFDVNRIEIIDHTPVMEQPNFESGRVAEGKKGAAEKPMMTKP